MRFANLAGYIARALQLTSSMPFPRLAVLADILPGHDGGARGLAERSLAIRASDANTLGGQPVSGRAPLRWVAPATALSAQ